MCVCVINIRWNIVLLQMHHNTSTQIIYFNDIQKVVIIKSEKWK